MGERKGQNKYYPPDYDPKVGGLNKFLGTHALRERARKLDQGILIIRFEMPYNIWCDGCQNHIGMGVRYNAEKTRTGMYYSTPLYKFRMKCHLCDNHFEIQTDPGNLDYIIVSGARRQENRWDPTDNGQIVPDDKVVQKRLFDDPMFKLEHTARDQKVAEDAKPVLGKLFERNVDVWRDPYQSNSKLRTAFREQKKDLKLVDERDELLLRKSSLSIELLPESEQDRKMAALMSLQAARTVQDVDRDRKRAIFNKPVLPSATITTFGGLKAEKLMSNRMKGSDLGVVVRRESKQVAIGTAAPTKKAKLSGMLVHSSSNCEKNPTLTLDGAATEVITQARNSLSTFLEDYNSSGSSENDETTR